MNRSTSSLEISVTAHELLDLLVRLIHTRQSCKLAGAHGGLVRLAEHLPIGIELGLDGNIVRMDGVQTTIRLFNASSE